MLFDELLLFYSQAVSFMLADMAIGVESSRLCYMKAGWQADHGMRNTYMASIAKCLAGDVANKVGTSYILKGVVGKLTRSIFNIF